MAKHIASAIIKVIWRNKSTLPIAEAKPDFCSSAMLSEPSLAISPVPPSAAIIELLSVSATYSLHYHLIFIMKYGLFLFNTKGSLNRHIHYFFVCFYKLITYLYGSVKGNTRLSRSNHGVSEGNAPVTHFKSSTLST
jgi:hypothetical protein